MLKFFRSAVGVEGGWGTWLLGDLWWKGSGKRVVRWYDMETDCFMDLAKMGWSWGKV